MMFFCEMLGGASTCICHFFCLSVRLFIILFIHRSIRLSIAHCIVSFCKTCSLKVNSKDTRVICVIFSKFATKEVRWSSKVSRNSISGLTDYAQFFFFLIFYFFYCLEYSRDLFRFMSIIHSPVSNCGGIDASTKIKRGFIIKGLDWCAVGKLMHQIRYCKFTLLLCNFTCSNQPSFNLKLVFHLLNWK